MADKQTSLTTAGALPQRRIGDSIAAVVRPSPFAFANDLMREPLVRKSLPFLAIGAIIAALLALASAVVGPDRVPLYPGLADADKGAIHDALQGSGIDVAINAATGNVEVPRSDLHAARMLLAQQGLPKASASGYELLDTVPFGGSRALEAARLQQSRETELARSIAEISGVEGARVHLAIPQPSAFVRNTASPSASVFVRLAPGRVLDEAQISAIVYLVASSVPGLGASSVSVIDQRGALLSKRGTGGLADRTAEQVAYRLELERIWRDRIDAVLGPTLGAGNYSAEVALDLDFRMNEMTRESYDKDQQVLRSEQASNRGEQGTGAARGIPGTLSNAAPPNAVLAEAGAAPAASAPQPAASRTLSEDYTRNYEIGKEVEVARDAFGEIRRASVAVVVKQAADGNGKPVPLPETERRALQTLVEGAVGYDKERGDSVVVTSRPFADGPEVDAAPFWEQPQLVSLLGRIGIPLIVLVLGIVVGKPIAQALAARLRAPPPPAPAAGDGMLASSAELSPEAGFDERLQLLRQLVASDISRASQAVGQLMAAEAMPRG
jgi:flagellar M-ring protein FliF